MIFISRDLYGRGLVVGITASGLDHKKARRIREEIQNALERVAQEDDNEEENDD